MNDNRMAVLVALALAVVAAAPPARAQLTYTESWAGNSFGGDNDHIQGQVKDFWVASNGYCYTNSDWDEWGRAAAVYNSSLNSVGPAAYGSGNNYYRDPSGNSTDINGYAVTGDGTYIYLGVGGSGLQRNNPNGSYGGWNGLSGDKIVGLAASGGVLAAADVTNNQVHIFTTSNMTETHTWSVATPGKLRLDSSGNLWVITGGVVKKYNQSGSALGPVITLPSSGVPVNLAFDNSGRLLVCDNGPNQNVKIYTNLSNTSPTLSAIYGVSGGVYGGSTAGSLDDGNGSLKLHQLSGVGVDSSGNIYVSMGADNGRWYTELVKFNTSQQVLARKFALFSNNAHADPASDGTNVYTNMSRYAMNYANTGAGSQWSMKAYTQNPFLYPDDPRLHMGCEAAWVVNNGGHKLLYTSGMKGGGVAVFRFNGEIAVPCALFLENTTLGSWPTNDPYQGQSGMLVWTDSNGDGQFNSNEFSLYTDVNPYTGAFEVDENGGVWQAVRPNDGHNAIVYYKVTLIGSNGLPAFSRNLYDRPSMFSESLHERYVPSTDTLYVSGFTSYPGYDPSKDLGNVVGKFVGWVNGGNHGSGATPAVTFNLPFNNTGNSSGTIPGAFDVCGPYLFTDDVYHANINVFDNSSGSQLGQFVPTRFTETAGGPLLGDPSGWLDMINAIRVTKRANGDYLVFAEENKDAKVDFYTWNPGAPIGKTITLKAVNGYYVSGDLNDASSVLDAKYQTSNVGVWEKFSVVDAGGGFIALKSSNGYYVSCDMSNGGILDAKYQTSTIGEWEKFTWQNLGGGNIALKANANGYYVSCDLNNNSVLTAKYQMTTPGTWETFAESTLGN
ncbi:hypothetical protein CCAX7_25480 [Capsulimonas corticalis]|uniref:Uncharacterized protein n=1 Tax=Capsulimonas corticalis TaxID=2219043 RepID=A0A402CVQ8_9BACT|nr:hypothetical protein [Capsulimonas corticalis]BDI30497.1 hypothetical protein CCAX7_25480 [Capsulimonas corticalis]